MNGTLRLFVTGLLSSAALFVACGDNNTGGGAYVGPPGGGTTTGGNVTVGTGGGPNGCSIGSPCPCGDGRHGFTDCRNGVASCDCSGCPAFKGEAAVQPSGCGGEPFGLWRLTSAEAKGIPGVISYGGSVVGYCPTMVTSMLQMPDLRLDLGDGGRVAVYRDHFSVGVAFLEQCASDVLGRATTCDDLRTGTLGCGVCTLGGSEPMIDDTGSWTRADNKLTLAINGESEAYTYCVEGDKMTLFTPLGIRVAMERVQKFGTPAACETRDISQCTRGSGCHQGLCVDAMGAAPDAGPDAGDAGSKCTSASSETDCTNRQGCKWDPTRCAGTAIGPCKLSEYDVVPGCKFVSPAAKCVGSAKACGGKTQPACIQTAGCKAHPGCVGGNVNCSKYTGACSICAQATGCSCIMQGEGTGICQGAATCEMQPDMFACKLFENCQWIPFVCTGTPTACEQLSITACASSEGCSVDFGQPASDAGAGD